MSCRHQHTIPNCDTCRIAELVVQNANMQENLTDLEEQLTALREAFIEHKYDEGRFPFDTLMALLEVKDAD
tara:strand:- start:342 stop:554 length:213 start_codon:yes stop_codon:yes gene_type:complete